MLDSSKLNYYVKRWPGRYLLEPTTLAAFVSMTLIATSRARATVWGLDITKFILRIHIKEWLSKLHKTPALKAQSTGCHLLFCTEIPRAICFGTLTIRTLKTKPLPHTYLAQELSQMTVLSVLNRSAVPHWHRSREADFSQPSLPTCFFKTDFFWNGKDILNWMQMIAPIQAVFNVLSTSNRTEE